MKTAIAFASTGGQKMARALRSLRRTEPELPVYIVLDVASRTWKANDQNPNLGWFVQQPNVMVRCIENSAYINGALNAAMRWIAELGCDYGCLFHDDVIFSPLQEHLGHLSEWFKRLESDAELQKCSALTLSLMQAFVPNDVWKRSPVEWDAMDLESESLWQILCPGGKPAGSYMESGHAYEIHLPEFLVQYHAVKEMCRGYRLGPSGQIVPVATWETVGGFDETEGIFYDIQYPAECAARGLPLIQMIPNIPHLHLHNQSIGFADPAFGVWSDTMGAFARRYGEYGAFWAKIVEKEKQNASVFES